MRPICLDNKRIYFKVTILLATLYKDKYWQKILLSLQVSYAEEHLWNFILLEIEASIFTEIWAAVNWNKMFTFWYEPPAFPAHKLCHSCLSYVRAVVSLLLSVLAGKIRDSGNRFTGTKKRQ